MFEATKRFRVGTHRTRTPEETWTWVHPRLADVGVSRIADVTALDRIGIPVYQAVRPASRNLCVSQGKGVTAAAARVGAAMEAVELWHAERLDHLPQVSMSLREMQRANPIATLELPWSPGAIYLDAAPFSWVELVALTGGGPGWLPRRMLELDFTERAALAPVLFCRTSNGLASGNTREEAVLHGLCELIERHALCLVQLGSLSKAAVREESVESDYCRELIRRLRAAGARLALWDATWAVGVPVVSAQVVLPDLPRVWAGSGCHPDRDVALSRALTEAAQSRLTFISGARDDLPGSEDRHPPHIAFEHFVEPAGERDFDALPTGAGESVADDLDWVLGRLAACGHRAYAVDLTRPEIGVPVVRSFVPHLGVAHHG